MPLGTRNWSRGWSRANRGTVVVPAEEESSLLTGLAAYWKLDEASSTRSDSVGSTHLADNGSSTSDTGIQGDCLETDGSQFLSVTNPAAIRIPASSSLTINVWVFGRPGAILAKGSESATQEYAIKADGTLGFWMGTGAVLNKHTGPAIPTGQWNMLTCIYDVDADEVRMHVNGGAATTAAQAAAVTAGTGNFNIGLIPGCCLSTGLTDECSIHTRALTTDEIAALYNAGAGVTHPFA